MNPIAIIVRAACCGAILSGALVATACNSDENVSENANVGTVSIPLQTTVGNSTYRLQAVFVVSGAPGFITLTTSADDPVLSTTLPTGPYYVFLQSFTLFRDDGTGTFYPVNATFISGNQYFSIYAQSTTTISFQFQTDGQVVPMGSGNLDVTVDVTEVPGACTILGQDCADGSWCAPPALTGQELACVPAGTVPVGSACKSPLECVAASTCHDFGDGPVCAALCTPDEFDGACGDDGTCLEVHPTFGICTPPAPGQCPPGVGGQNCDHFYTHVSVGGAHTCALTTLGTIDCWGDDTNGVSSPPSGTFSTVEAGSESNCAIGGDGLIQCWGLIEFGDPNPPSGPFVELSSGNTFHYCAIRSDGSVACWGSNNVGQGSPPPGAFTRISTYYNGSAGLRPDGSIEFWGDTAGLTTKPGPYLDMALGEAHACAIKPDHTLECFNMSQSIDQTPPSGTYQSLTIDGDTNCAIATDGTVACWGSNVWGDNSLGKAVPPDGHFSSISLAPQHGCGVLTNNRIRCWGNPAWGFHNP